MAYSKASAFGGSGGFSDPMTTRGDIIVRDASNVTNRLATGSADQVLGSDGTDTTWVTLSHTVLGDIGTNTHAQIDTHIASTANPHSVTKAQVGLTNADDTSDADKPISTATQTALDAKLDDFTSTTDNALVRTNGILGEAVQDSGILIDDSDNMSSVGTFSSGAITTSGAIDQASATSLDIAGTTATTLNLSRTGQTTVVKGNLQVDGTTTTVNSTTLDVADANITVNSGGNAASADDTAGLTVEMSDATDCKIIYDAEAATKFRLGVSGSEVEIVDLSATQTLTNKTLTSPSITTPTGIVKGDVGLGNVDNTSDATKDAATATLTNKTMTRIANTFTRTVTTYSSVQTLSATVDDVVKVSGNTTLNLPAAASSSGVEFLIKKTDSNATTVTLDGNASEEIDGATTFTITEQYASYTIICDGTGWLIV